MHGLSGGIPSGSAPFDSNSQIYSSAQSHVGHQTSGATIGVQSQLPMTSNIGGHTPQSIPVQRLAVPYQLPPNQAQMLFAQPTHHNTNPRTKD